MERRTPEEKPLSALVGQRGIKTTSDFAEFFTALMTDVVEGNVDAQDATAICKAGDKVLRVVELEYQHGAGQPLQLCRRVIQQQRPSLANGSTPPSETDPNRLQ